MKRIVNHTFFKFFIGFIAILFISFAVTSFVAQISQETVDPNTQTACETSGNC